MEYSGELGDVPKYKLATSRHVTRTHSMKAINACLLFCSIIGGLVGFGYLVFDPIVKHIILNKLILTNSSDFAQVWENPPITPHLKIYMYNLTNAENFFKYGAKPRLDEVGPYVYHQKWIKENVRWHNNGTMSYSTRKVFKFMPELSVGDQNEDVIITLNVPVLSAYYQMRNAGIFSRWGLETIVDSLMYDMWINKTVEELIWGYDEPLFGLARLTLPNPPTSDKFGFFTEKNASEKLATYTMFTGEGNPYQLSRISLFNGNHHMDFWKSDQCNVVQGSDGATFNPYIKEDDTLWFFNDQLCRSLPLVFKEKVYSESLPGLRFVPRDDVFLSRQSHPDNDCFCVDEDLCSMIGDGFYPISACQFDAPIVISWPHFLGANQSFFDALDGVRPPQYDKHAFWFDIQPITGTTLSAKARVQINMAIKRNDNFNALSNIKDTIMPILWFEEGIDALGQDLIDILTPAVHGPPQYKNYVLCVFLGFLLSSMVIGAVAVCRILMNRRQLSRGEECRKIAKHIINHRPGGGSIEDPSCQQPMLSDSGNTTGYNSRLTTATHSRNTSTGSNTFNETKKLIDTHHQKSTTSAPVLLRH